MAKRLVNFRLSQKAIHTLALLEEKLHTTKTATIELALDIYAKQQHISKNSLLAFAGILEAKTADKMLHDIRTHRKNKRKGISL